MSWHPGRLRRVRTPLGWAWEPVAEEMCDFCLRLSPEWAYPAVDHDVPHSTMIDQSQGEYAACQSCHELIEASNVGGLVERMYREQKAQEGPNWRLPPAPLARRLMRENVLRFMDARNGLAYPNPTPKGSP